MPAGRVRRTGARSRAGLARGRTARCDTRACGAPLVPRRKGFECFGLIAAAV